MQNKVRVTICGKEYALQTDEAPDYIIKLSRRLDKQIQDMVNSADNISVAAASMLVALSALDEATKATEATDNIRSQVKDYVDDANKARSQRDEALKEIEQLKVKISCLENDLKLKKLKDSL